jgi:hypothetical protein
MTFLIALALLGGCGLGLLFLAQEFVLRRYGRAPDGTPVKANSMLVFVLNGLTGVVALVVLVQVMGEVRRSSTGVTLVWAVVALLLGLGATYLVGRWFLPPPGALQNKDGAEFKS